MTIIIICLKIKRLQVIEIKTSSIEWARLPRLKTLMKIGGMSVRLEYTSLSIFKRRLSIKGAEEMTYHKEEYTLHEVMNHKYKTRKDKDNIFGVGLTDAEFREFIIDYLLGKDWYVVDPLSQTQINEIALYEILEKYSKRYRKEHRKWLKEQNK